MVKTPGLFKCFTCLPEHQLIYTDVNSLEPHVMAQLSQDPNLMKLYGKGRPKNDIYLFSGANISMFSAEIRKHYDPDNPTPETLKAAKDNCGESRQLLKKCVLMLLYNAFPKRLHAELTLAGYDITMREVRVIYEEFWHTYAGVKRFETALLRQCDRNGGWVYNGRGRPLCVFEKKRLDIINTLCQSTGHDCLMRLLLFINKLRHERRAKMKPYLCDLHDSTTWQYWIPHEELAKEIYRTAYKQLNDELQWDVEITGDIKIGRTLADVSLG
jgi:acyl-CoA-binding protein